MLFFSSDRTPNYGKMDVYLSYRDNASDWENWSEPMLLSYEFNTNKNDYAAKVNDKEIIIKEGFSLERGGYKKITRKADKVLFDFLTGTTTDINNEPTSAAILIVDSATATKIAETKSNTRGFFAYEKSSNNIKLIALKDGCIPALLTPNEIKLQLTEIKLLIAKSKIHNIEYLFDENIPDKLSKISKLYLSFLAKEFVELPYIVGVSVYCANGFKNMSAKELAQVQANLIKSELIANGVPSNTIVAVGFDKGSALKPDDEKINSIIEIGFIENQ
jgi:hypothetical protein